VRRAVQLAFPQDKIASVMFGGRVEDANGLIPPGMLGESWPATVEPFDLPEARAEIGRSRYGRADLVPPIRIYGGDPVGAMALSDALGEELGLRVEVIEVDWSDLLDGLSRHEFSAFELHWGADYPDPESFLLSLFGSASADNYINYDQPEFDALLHEAASTANTAERAVLYQDAQIMLLRDRVAIPLYFDVRFDVVDPAVQGLTITTLGILSLESIWMER
jgi:ABC-type oligopeptide transport system substrate-binding subunit